MEINLEEKKRIGKAISDVMTNTTMRGEAFFAAGCEVAIEELMPYFVAELLDEATSGEVDSNDAMAVVGDFLKRRKQKYVPKDPALSAATKVIFYRFGGLIGKTASDDFARKVVEAVDEARGGRKK